MSFSKGLVLADLDDFITPSQACVKPVEKPAKSVAGNGQENSARADGALPRMTIEIDGDTGDHFEYDEHGTATKLETATISLTDCLACSGCITSAETVLVQMQSHHELYKVLENNSSCRAQGNLIDLKVVVVSLSPQACASFAAKYSLPGGLEEAAMKLTAFLKGLGVDYVFDIAIARDVSLIESSKEFLHRYQTYQAAAPQGKRSEQPQILPMLASACPGWICYAEKTHGQLLGYVSITKSPQQIMGSIVKQFFAKRNNISPDHIYHVTVMPCYDKKLEASREDFYSDIYSTRDVDCVLTSGEVERMLQDHNLAQPNLSTLGTSYMDCIFSLAGTMDYEAEVAKTCQDTAWNDYGRYSSRFSISQSSAGGYLEFTMMAAAHFLYGKEILSSDLNQSTDSGVLSIRTIRNSDFREIVLQDEQGKPLLKFASAYGFRNLQNIVRKLKMSPSPPYHYVEVMACPSGKNRDFPFSRSRLY
ncbi:Cytosolic Fe-S cluster assembly factor nar1, variant 2 [Entomophthora muscae]|uniref:Cytosolic Fe-S cluster assembly factor nar1, variant 2 n=1 Tax=Entomophthora muscae TaxID=34485 RepID=A0ACC2SQT3_9FUNG|nr:Cytosolic Fe-S cluster assembly factor nar1, variant 2 [Entomophthora muscae]